MVDICEFCRDRSIPDCGCDPGECSSKFRLAERSIDELDDLRDSRDGRIEELETEQLELQQKLDKCEALVKELLNTLANIEIGQHIYPYRKMAEQLEIQLDYPLVVRS